MRVKIIFLFVFIFIIHLNGTAQKKGDIVFDADVLHEIRFYSETEPDLYAMLQQEALEFERPYHLVRMEFDGVEMDSIGIRAKGFFSAVDTDQTPLKIDINEYINGQSFDGLKKFGLTNSFLDPTRQYDRVSYELFRRVGIPSPRTSYAEVYVNDVFVEVYLIVQQIDKTFIKEHFADEGHLMKIFELIYGEDVFSGEVLFVQDEIRLEKVDLRSFFKFLIVNSLVGAQDNYPSNNFYVYKSEKENLFYFLPWDYNISFELATNFTSFSPEDIAAIWSNPTAKAIFLEVACEISDYLLNETYVSTLIDNNLAIIESNSQGSTVENHESIKIFLKNAQETLKNQLITEGADCIALSYPFEIGDLVINEFVAKSDSIGGVQEPNGGTPDWVELYNNSDQDIVLNHHFYLSDDIDFPKKWNFKTPITIPANGYQIIWADRDIHQDGVHSNFKIEKSEGDLMLVYEDLTVIDQVTYEEQELNIAYARVPNGTGSFVHQAPTFNASNESNTSIRPVDGKQSIRIFPNPADQVVNIIAPDEIIMAEIYTSNGRMISRYIGDLKKANIGSLNAGIYFIHIQTLNDTNFLKLIKK